MGPRDSAQRGPRHGDRRGTDSQAEGGHASPGAESAEGALEGTGYRYVRGLARGGMGTVCEVEHLGLAKVMVMKLLLPHLATRRDLADRLRVEARAMTHIAHPNIAAVTDFGHTRCGRPFLVMERLAGCTLKGELQARGALPVLEAIDFTLQVLAGLGAAHRANVIHRDIKLDNLFVCEPDAGGRRVVKVLDFGIAKVRSEAGSASPMTPAFRTEDGTVLGTPAFLSPEQAMGRPVDARTDIYGTAIVLYRLLAGRGPFVGRDMLDLIKAHVAEQPLPPSVHAAQRIPKALDDAILTALSKRPDDRFPSCAAFARALEDVALSVRLSARAPADDAGHMLDDVTTEMRAAPSASGPEGPTLELSLPGRPTLLPSGLAESTEIRPRRPAASAVGPRPLRCLPAPVTAASRLQVVVALATTLALFALVVLAWRVTVAP